MENTWPYEISFGADLNSLIIKDIIALFYVNIGCDWKISGIFGKCSLYDKLENCSMMVPLPKPLPGSRNAVLYAMVGDEAFPLKSYLLKMFPSRQLDKLKPTFNNRLSRARRIVKNVFGIMGERFAFFQKPIALDTGKVEIILLAACALQNVLETKCQDMYMPTGSIDQENLERNNSVSDWRSGPTPQGNCIGL